MYQVSPNSFATIVYHHGIRPCNILVEPDNFLITDFGLAKLKDSEENSATEWKLVTANI